MVRAFQVASLFLEETVYDNVYSWRRSRTYGQNRKMLKDKYGFKDAGEHADMILTKIGLYRHRNTRRRQSFPTGIRRSWISPLP